MLNNNFHGVLQQKIFEVLLQSIKELGLETYLVGGFVRDHLLGTERAKDIDIVAIGSGIELAQVIQKKLTNASPLKIFKSYGTAMIKWEGITIEFVGARKESYSRESLSLIHI